MKKRRIAALILLMLILSSCKSQPKLPDIDVSAMQDGEQVITDELREVFFELGREYRLDYVPKFERGEVPDAMAVKWHAVVLDISKIVIGYEELHGKFNGTHITGKYLEEVAKKYYGISYGLENDDKVMLEIGSVNGPPFFELVGYSIKRLDDGKYEVTAKLHGYQCLQFFLSDDKGQKMETLNGVSTDGKGNPWGGSEVIYPHMQETGLTPYYALRDLIIKGDTDGLEPHTSEHVITYISKDGITPEKIISGTRKGWGGDGYY